MRGVYITGTDTGVGKTLVCGLLAGFLRGRGFRVATQKWVQTGTGGQPADLAVHRRFMGLPEEPPAAELPDLCPYRFPFPASPHLAAAREGKVVEARVIEAAYRRLAASHEIVLVEGAGGFLVPLADGLLAGDLVARLGLAVLVVVGNRLGCINHALLTVEAVRGRGVPMAGLIFNRPPMRGGSPPEEVCSDNVRVVERLSGIRVLGEVPFLPDPAAGAEAFAPTGRSFLDRWRPE
jgi:dethiobiotin synthetase